jgi:hypothetical protein
MRFPDTIQTASDIRAFITCLVGKEGLNFHPDTPFAEYVNYSDGTPTYTQEECDFREELLDQCFAVGGEETYSIGLEVFRAITGLRAIPTI